MNGAEAIVKCLEAEGITKIFGYPGVAIAPFYDALYRSGSISHILVRQEQAAGHAASGYSRISGKTAVCVTSSGLGAANIITAFATVFFSVLVENQDGVLSQISGLFARRGFNIDSLAVGETERHDISSMTIVSKGSSGW